MEKEISKGLKYLFLFHFIAGIVFGLIYLFMPVQYADLVNWPLKEAPTYRLIGAALCGYGLSSWMAYKSAAWESVKILVLTEIVWCGIAGLLMVYNMLYEGLPPIGWLNTVILLFFAGAFAYFYQREK